MKYHVSGVSGTHILPKDLGTAVLLPSGTLAQSCASLCPWARVLTHCNRMRLGGLAPFYRWKPEVQEYLVYSHPHPLCSEMFAGSSSPIGWVQTCLVRHSRLPMIAPQSITAVCLMLLLHSHPTPAEMTYSLFPYPSSHFPFHHLDLGSCGTSLPPIFMCLDPTHSSGSGWNAGSSMKSSTVHSQN